MKTITLAAREGFTGQPAAIPAEIRAVLPGSSRLPQTALAADNLLIPNQLPLVPTRRLVVLVPAGEIDEHALARRIWQLASCSGLDVLYMTLSPDADQWSYQRRRLVSLAALTTYPGVRADIGVHAAKNWSRALRQILKPGDLLVCLAEDYTPGIFRRRAVGERLAAGLGVPVYEFGGIQVKPSRPSLYWVKNVLGWGASMTLMAAFFWLQVGIDHSSPEPQSTILLYLSVVVEIYLLWKINEWIG